MTEEKRFKISWREAAEKWTQGNTVWSVELGGLGPGYEQAIQILLWEILAGWLGPNLELSLSPKEYPSEYDQYVDAVTTRLDKPCLGFSGAQVGQAKSLAYTFLTAGYSETMNHVPSDRLIQVSKAFPHI